MDYADRAGARGTAYSPRRGSAEDRCPLGDHRRDQPLTLYRGEFLAQLGRRMASDHGARHSPHADAHPDVLLLLSTVGHLGHWGLPLWPIPASRALLHQERLSVVILSFDHGGGA